MWQKPFVNFVEAQVYFNTIWVYMFLELFFGVFVSFFLIKIWQKHTFFFGPFTSDFADAISIISKTTTC